MLMLANGILNLSDLPPRAHSWMQLQELLEILFLLWGIFCLNYPCIQTLLLEVNSLPLETVNLMSFCFWIYCGGNELLTWWSSVLWPKRKTSQIKHICFLLCIDHEVIVSAKFLFLLFSLKRKSSSTVCTERGMDYALWHTCFETHDRW